MGPELRSFIQVEEVLTRDLSTGRLHRRLRAHGKLYTQEGCNLDQAGRYAELTQEDAARALETAEAGDLCENDWPESVPADRLERYVEG